MRFDERHVLEITVFRRHVLALVLFEEGAVMKLPSLFFEEREIVRGFLETGVFGKPVRKAFPGIFFYQIFYALFVGKEHADFYLHQRRRHYDEIARNFKIRASACNERSRETPG